MNKLLLKSSFFISMVLCIGISTAQNVVKVSPGFATLNKAITTEAAKGVDIVSNTIFELKRGGVYLLNGSVQNDGFTLNIRAEEGTGERPKLIPAVASGGESERPFRPRGDLSIKGLYVTNKDELGRINLRIIRCSADDITIRIDDCVLDMDNQAAIRLDNKNNSIFMTNTTVSNIGLPSDPANGRGVDDRGNDIDSLVIENCTFYNITARVLRDDGGIINYSRINHNHFVNIGQRLITFGEIIEAEFTNNMVVNAGFYGAYPGSDFELIELDTLKKDLVNSGITQTVKINNNNFFLSEEITSIFPDSITIAPVYDSIAQVFAYAPQSSKNTQLNEEIIFTKSAVLPTYITSVYWKNPEGTPSWNNTGTPYDFEYANTFQSYTYSDAGQPLGDLRWFDMDIISSAKTILNKSDGLSFKLFPNPAVGELNISFKLETSGNVEIDLYNMMGQKIQSGIRDYYSVGSHTINFDVSNLNSGMYIYKITSGNIYDTETIVIK